MCVDVGAGAAFATTWRLTLYFEISVGAAAQDLLPSPGSVLSGKYRIERTLGEGGMGVVYEATHLRLKQRVAIKMLLPELLGSADVVSRFEREARAAGQLRSPNTARVLDVESTADGIPFMVLELLEGHDLSTELERRGPLPIGEAVDYVLQACNAMREAHGVGIVHRDLKPSNLFLARAGNEVTVKVLDFGISKVESDKEARVTATQTTVGTPLYMSPEQIRSAKHVDARTDVWALGIILYELLAGRTPFEGSAAAAAVAICVDPVPPLRAIRPDVPPELEALVLRALEKAIDKRIPSVDAFAAALAPYAATPALASGRHVSVSYPSALPAPVISSPVLTGEHAPLSSTPSFVAARTEVGAADPHAALLSPGSNRSLERVGGGSSRTEGSWTTGAQRRGRKSASPRGVTYAALGALGAVVLVAIGVVFWARLRPAPIPSAPATAVTLTASTVTATATAPPPPLATTPSTAGVDSATPPTVSPTLPTAKPTGKAMAKPPVKPPPSNATTAPAPPTTSPNLPPPHI
jgi:serine/threonine-protein kinase